ncbi:hypothetical protein [Nocardioides nitrophenolicus]|uniref:hypothetical protein n=1 Tax=Nocardioides nitrophenolicus TaxID=60489 RepID=UPI00195F0C63|nr:hypothetical protein [Nocardioides nitrophenolicus]MBM7515907.1 hypothetical protein [Nocardioides nitrophenolicus]
MTDDLLTLLRSLDPADPPAGVAGGVDARAEADLARILATAPDRAPRRRPTRVVGATAAAVTVVAGGVVLAPSVVGGDAAFATWSPHPREVVGTAARADAAGTCRDHLADASAVDGAGLARAVPAIAERRGDWTLVLLSGAGGFSGLCITDDSRRLFDDLIGSVGTADVPAPGARGLIATDLGTGSLDAGELSLVAGLAGDDVVGVAYESAAHGRVEASLGEGRFALWFPGDELADGGPVPLEVTYADGSVGSVDVDL